uniref:Methyltransferase FkbM domain-containing protein n=1 Tax=viral metagenome TaxID=1070528 RepID=A0A6C0H6H1_9ZZZZ
MELIETNIINEVENKKEGVGFLVNLYKKTYGSEIFGKNPQIFIYKNVKYILFQCIKNNKKCMAITKYNEYRPTFLRIKNDIEQKNEKNWAILIKNDEIYFIQKLYPLTILYLKKIQIYEEYSYCNIIYKECENDEEYPKIRAMTEFIPYNNSKSLYISCGITKCFINCPIYCIFFFILNTNTWKFQWHHITECFEIPVYFYKTENYYYLHTNNKNKYKCEFNVINCGQYYSNFSETIIKNLLEMNPNPKENGKSLDQNRYNIIPLKEYYGESYQDLFVLKMTNKKNGVYLEIGSNDPIENNNTFILEKKYGWRGILIEIDSKFKELYKIHRPKSEYVINDACNIDYLKILEKYPKNIDYLQIDLEVTNRSTLNLLEIFDKTVFSSYKFSCITFEHDIYRGDYFETQKKSREIFKKWGYVLIYSNVSNYIDWIGKWCPYEDWYIHPDLIDVNKILYNFSHKNTDLKDFFVSL